MPNIQLLLPMSLPGSATSPLDKAMPFFRLEKTGQRFGVCLLYEVWKRATAKLGITDVDLYGGTKHSTAMGLRDGLTFEQVRSMTQHTTNKAFERYFRIEGSALRDLYAQRKTVINLITS